MRNILFGPYVEEFLNYVKNNPNVTIKDIEDIFGKESQQLIEHHRMCGYIDIVGDSVIFIRDTY